MISVLIFLEYATAIVGSIFYKKFASRFTALFLCYLWYIVLTETYSSYVLYSSSQASTRWIFVIYTFVEFNMLFLMYYSITKVKLTKKIITVFLIIVNIIYFAEVFSSGFLKHASITTVVGSIFLSLVLIFYLIEFLYSDKILNYSRSLYFWVTIGSLVYYLGSIPYQAIINYLKNSNLTFLQIGLAIFAQTCVLIGFLWSKKEEI